MTYACVIVDISIEKLNHSFIYRIPEHLQEVLRIGMEVKVPFGNGNRVINGYVVDILRKAPQGEYKIKDIMDISRDRNPIEARLVELAAWMAKHYGGTMIQALKTVIPAGKKVKEVSRKTVILKADEEGCRKWEDYFTGKNQKARKRLLEELMRCKSLPYDILTSKLHVTGKTLDFFLQEGIVEIDSERLFRDLEAIKSHGGERKEIILNPCQCQAIERVTRDLQREIYGTYLIHGVTGSGKTEVYIDIIEDVVKRGGQAIVLIPEISLTYQTVMRFYGRFGNRVSVMNSRLSQGERYDQYQRAKSGELDVVIGPRSALFTPFPNLKLIVIDEEHEHTYKSEITPCYHAREVAIERGRLEKAGVVLGSATPSMESYQKAKDGEYTLLELPGRAISRKLPDVEIVDLRQELKKGNREMFSEALDRAIRKRLDSKDAQQIMLFINRRGFAGHVACRECGYVVKCDHCDVSMSQHKEQGKTNLRCHYCGETKEMPATCPVCGSRYIGGFRAGTQAVETFIKKKYPESRVLRMDTDTTGDKEGHARILSAFAAGEADILIGTQMIIKGHDFPNVTLVGILAADLSLYAGEYKASERTFQMLTQAAGRAGRGNRPGEVIIQTYDPNHYAIRLAATQDYESFYEAEKNYRELLGYPPFGHVLQIFMTGQDAELLNMAADYLKRYGAEACERYGIVCVGPGDPPVSKVKDRYRKVLYFKHENYDILIRMRKYLDAYIRINTGFQDIFIQYGYDM